MIQWSIQKCSPGQGAKYTEWSHKNNPKKLVCLSSCLLFFFFLNWGWGGRKGEARKHYLPINRGGRFSLKAAIPS